MQNYGARRNTCRIFMGEPEVKKPLGRHRYTREDIIKEDLREVEWGCVDWVDLIQNRDQWRALVNTVMKLRDP
jgi:hypothetical protein